MARSIRRNAHHHGAYVMGFLICQRTDLHGEVGDIGYPGNTLHPQNSTVGIFIQARGLGIRALGVFLHHPHICATVIKQDVGIIHHATVNASHRQRHTDQQSQADAGKYKLPPGVQDVTSG